jgi:hypothetical protein
MGTKAHQFVTVARTSEIIKTGVILFVCPATEPHGIELAKEIPVPDEPLEDKRAIQALVELERAFRNRAIVIAGQILAEGAFRESV